MVPVPPKSSPIEVKSYKFRLYKHGVIKNKNKQNFIKNVVNTLYFLKRDLVLYIKSLMSKKLNFCKHECCIYFREQDSAHNFFRNMEIYNKLWKLLEKTDCKEPNYFIIREECGSARQYAGCLWDYRNLHENSKCCPLRNDFSLAILLKTVLKMSGEDARVIQKILLDRYFVQFSELAIDMSLQRFQDCLLAKILSDKKTSEMIIAAIHTWFLIFPILEELSRYLGWKQIFDANACLLDLDSLYQLLINKLYQNGYKSYTNTVDTNNY